MSFNNSEDRVELGEATIGERLRLLRECRGNTLLDVSKVMCVSQQTVSNWENNKRSLSIDFIIKLAEHYNVSCDYILRGVKSENVEINHRLGVSNRVIEAIENLYHQDKMYGNIAFNSLFAVKDGDSFIFDSILRDMQSIFRDCAKIEIENLLSIGGSFHKIYNIQNSTISRINDEKGEFLGLYNIALSKSDFIDFRISHLEDRIKRLIKEALSLSLDVLVSKTAIQIINNTEPEDSRDTHVAEKEKE